MPIGRCASGSIWKSFLAKFDACFAEVAASQEEFPQIEIDPELIPEIALDPPVELPPVVIED